MSVTRIARPILALLICAASNAVQSKSSEQLSPEVIDLMKSGRHNLAAERMSPALALQFAGAFDNRKQMTLRLLYLRSAAFRNSPEAQFQLAQTLSSNSCCSRNPVEAFAWISQVSGPDARALKTTILNQLTEGELRYALNQASDLGRRLTNDDRQGWQEPSLCAIPEDPRSETDLGVCSYHCSTKPEYPNLARRAEATGLVHLDFSMNEHGSVVSTTLRRSSGRTMEHKYLDRVTSQFVNSCQFPSKLVDPTRIYTVKYRWLLQ
jgi:TonB family protein